MSDGVRDAYKAQIISGDKGGSTKVDLSQGTKLDDGKIRMDLLPSAPLKDIAEVLTFGAKKYAAHNWRKGINYSRVYGALQRHLSAWNEGEDTDPESGLNHLAHAGCCLLFLLEYTHSRTQYDDRYKGDKK